MSAFRKHKTNKGLRIPRIASAASFGRNPPLLVHFSHARPSPANRTFFAFIASATFIDSPAQQPCDAPGCAEAAAQPTGLRKLQVVTPRRALPSLITVDDQAARSGCLAIVLLRAVTGRPHFWVAAELNLLSGTRCE